MRRAPWPDFAGNPIHEGDTIRHPHSGESGVVVFLPMYPDPGDAWRVNYGDQYESRLCLQIDNKGMAVVVPATDLPTPKGTPVSIDKQLPAYKSHKTVWALKIASIQQAPVQSVTDGGSWRITPANTTFCPFEVPHSYVQKHRPEEGGYWVQYEDGYQSYSPAKAFEEGYTPVADQGLKGGDPVPDDLRNPAGPLRYVEYDENPPLAPGVTLSDIDACIASEYYFRASAAAFPDVNTGRGPAIPYVPAGYPELSLLTFCAMVLHNGHLVTGESYCADPAKFNAETGRIEARKVAIEKLWPMVIYGERQRLHEALLDQKPAHHPV